MALGKESLVIVEVESSFEALDIILTAIIPDDGTASTIDRKIHDDRVQDRISCLTIHL